MLAAIHDKRVAHRDISPDNILVDERSSRLRLVYVDFGISKAIVTDAGVEATCCGKPGYVSLPILRGDADVDHYAADLFALGVTLFQVCTGKHPFGFNSARVEGSSAAEDPWMSWRKLLLDRPAVDDSCVPERFKQCLCRCLAVDGKQPGVNARSIFHDLRSSLQERSGRNGNKTRQGRQT